MTLGYRRDRVISGYTEAECEGDPNASVPINGLPSLHAAFAMTVPSRTVSWTDGICGLNVRVRVGEGGGVGDGDGDGDGGGL